MSLSPPPDVETSPIRPTHPEVLSNIFNIGAGEGASAVEKSKGKGPAEDVILPDQKKGIDRLPELSAGLDCHDFNAMLDNTLVSSEFPAGVANVNPAVSVPRLAGILCEAILPSSLGYERRVSIQTCSPTTPWSSTVIFATTPSAKSFL